MKRVLFISANRYKEPYPVYPIGISYLKAYLETKLEDFEFDVFDCNLGSDEQLCDKIRSLKPKYICVSIRNVDGANSLDKTSFIYGYANIIKQIRLVSDSCIIVGGAAFSIYPKAMFDALKPNYGIIGEGEESLYRAIIALDKGEDLSTIEGMAFYNNAEFICNKHSSYLSSLHFKCESSLVDYYWREGGVLNIQTKRGCPYKCIYCSYPIIDGRCVRTLDADNVVETIKYINKTTGANYLFFTDSVFNISNNYNIELAEKLIASGIKINWGAYFSPHNLSDDLLGLFKASGLTHIEFGTESFSNSQLKNYGKNFSFDDVYENSNLCLKHNIFYSHFLILGGYGETMESIRETIENSKKIKYSVYFPFFGMRIYPGTRLSELAIEDKIITRDDSLLEPSYYVAKDLDFNKIKQMAIDTGKAWIFPDDPKSDLVDVLRKKKGKKGLLWEYLRKP